MEEAVEVIDEVVEGVEEELWNVSKRSGIGGIRKGILTYF